MTAFAAATPSVQVPRISESVLSPSEAAEGVPVPLKPGSYTIALRVVVHRRQRPVSPLSHDSALDPAIILNPDLTVGMTICRRMLPQGAKEVCFESSVMRDHRLMLAVRVPAYRYATRYRSISSRAWPRELSSEKVIP